MPATGAAVLLTTRLLGGASQVAQLWCGAAVMDKYRGAGARGRRTDTMGRTKLAAWSLEFGSGGEAVIHVSMGEAQARIPQGERAHWAAHSVTPALSANYVAVQLTHGTCVDDGDLRDG